VLSEAVPLIEAGTAVIGLIIVVISVRNSSTAPKEEEGEGPKDGPDSKNETGAQDDAHSAEKKPTSE